MSREKKDVQKAIRDLQRERRKIDEAIKATKDAIFFLSHISTKNRFNNIATSLGEYMSSVEAYVKKLIKKIKLVRRSQNYPTRDLVRAVEKIDQSNETNVTTYPLVFVLRQDIRIQENIESRTKSLDRLFNRFLAYIKVEKKRIMTISPEEDQYQEIRTKFSKRITSVIQYIHQELLSEKEIIGQEINKLSNEIEKLE